MINYKTNPIQAGNYIIGDKESEIKPFENHTFDFTHVNEYLAMNPAVQKHIIPDAMVSSCSECCMETINGQPNLLGYLFRKSRGGQGCHLCPVSLASESLPARDSDGNYLKNSHGKILSEADMIRTTEDGEK